MEKVKLDLIPGKVLPVCHASQYDVGRIIRFDLVENDTPYTLDGTETVTLGERKIDGNVVTAALTVVASKTYVDLITTEQMTACYGQNLCELKIEKGSDIIGTLNFVLDVERDPLEGGVQSESEIYNLQVQVNEIIQQELENYDIYGAYVTEQISGAVANFTDGADDVPVKALSVEFAATQASGTPTPANPIPIVGVNKVNVTRTGKNLFNSAISNFINTSKKTWGVSDANIVAFLNTLKEGTYKLTYKIKVDAINGTGTDQYGIIISNSQSGQIRTRETESNVTVGSIFTRDATITITASNKGLFENCWFYTGRPPIASSDNCTFYEMQIEIGSTATDYEPYQGTTALINLGGTYYGGSVDKDGNIILTKGYVDMGSLNWTKTSATQFNLFRATVSDIKENSSYSTAPNLLCPIYKPVAPNDKANHTIYVQVNQGHSVDVIDNDCADVPALISRLNGVIMAYELATPATAQASNAIDFNTLYGVNNFFSDAGDVDVTIRANTALYIDKRLNA